MISLIACDIDGTLLHGGERQIAPAVFSQIRRLMDKGIAFCPASGRQYGSLQRLFAPLGPEMYCLCENGAAIFGPGGRLLSKTPLPRDLALGLCHEILEVEDCEVLISGENTSYLCPKGPEIAYRMEHFTGNNVAIVASPEAVPEEILKVSAYCPAGALGRKKRLTLPWAAQAGPTMAGENWLDFTLATKGTGIRQLCDAMGISPEEVLAVGDNDNDVPMLEMVGSPYIMENAAPHLLSRFPAHCRRVEELLSRL